MFTRIVASTTLRSCTNACLKESLNQNSMLDVRLTRLSAIYHLSTSNRNYSRGKGFLGNLVDTLKQEYNQDSELKENIKKFRKEAQELEDSEALKNARKKFKKIEKETAESTEVVHEAFEKVKTKFSEKAEELGKTDIGKAAGRFSDGLSDAAKQAADSEAFQKVQAGLSNIAQGTGVPPSSLYRAPTVVRMRKDQMEMSDREVEANTDATNVVMHKDSVWNQQWETFKNSKVGERISEMKMQYDESDNILIRSSRFFTDKITNIAGGMFGGTEISKVMTEIARIEPDFSAVNFIEFCRHDVIPNLLEAIARGNDEVVKDWCSEAPYNQLIFPVKQAQQIGCKYELKTVDVDHVDIAGATKVDQGPVLVISFQTQQIMVVRNKKGDVVEGNEDQVMRVYHVWALCRDVEEMSPRSAWKIIDQSMSATPMLL